MNDTPVLPIYPKAEPLPKVTVPKGIPVPHQNADLKPLGKMISKMFKMKNPKLKMGLRLPKPGRKHKVKFH